VREPEINKKGEEITEKLSTGGKKREIEKGRDESG
jgi:hypothetical protein